MGTAFDTLAYAERLKAAGIENAHAHADALRAAVGEGVAKKADVRKVRADIARVEENMAKKLNRILLDKHMDFINNKMATKTDIDLFEMRRMDRINRAMIALAGLMIALTAVGIIAVRLMT